MGIPGAHAQARLGRYELLARLATGGMGEIFLARLEGAAGFEKLYVVKRILPHLADDARFRQMLISEAQIAAKMTHANICHVYELGETAGQLYIVMEYLEGITTLPLLRRASKANAPLELGFIGAVVQQTCDALHYAHEIKDPRTGEYLGLVHRDVSPSNIFLTESGVAKVLDFGIAKAKGATSTKTEDGAVKGKYAYMAPEQLRGASIDRRVDLFALGVMLYEMLALRRLFQRKTDYLTFRAVMEQPIPEVRRYRPDLPIPVADAVHKALERDPDRRFETARQLGSAMLDALGAAGMRPWTQGEVGDFVKANFADEIGKRSQQVMSAVSRTATGAHSMRATMPLIAQDTSFDHDDDDDDAFPSVETDIDAAPPMPVDQPPATYDPFQGSTPPPFAAPGESTGSAPSLQPLRGTGMTAAMSNGQVVVVGRRSMLWPILTVAMIAVAGGALFLVWKQTQNQQPQQPAVINVTQERDPRDRGSATQPPPGPTETHDGSAATGSGHGGGTNGLTNGRKPPKHFATYDQAINAQKPAMVQCLNDHRDDIPSEEITAMIGIAASGRAKSVQLRPAALNAAPLGACFRNVLMATPFPSAAKDNDISVPLKPKNT